MPLLSQVKIYIVAFSKYMNFTFSFQKSAPALHCTSKVNSVQEACTKCFAVHILKFEILQTTWINETKDIKMLNLLVKNWKLSVCCSLFHFFMWFARFNILICEPQSIWCKLLVLSWLYTENLFRTDQNKRQVSWKSFCRFKIRENMWWTLYRKRKLSTAVWQIQSLSS